MADRQIKPHAIIFPLPHQGHINPFINLALKLASNGFTITFVNLEFIHQMLSKSNKTPPHEFDLFFEARKSGFDIRYATISDGFPPEFDRSLNLEEFWDSMIRGFADRVDEFVGKIIEEQCDPCLDTFLILDTFFSWTANVAEKYNLVNVSFWTEPALVFSLVYHSDLLKENGHFPLKDNIEEEINYIPGVQSVNTKDFMRYLKESNLTSIAYKHVVLTFKDVRKADFILHNTVHELESDTLSPLNKHQSNYAIGPINFVKNLATSTVHKSLWSESDCTDWLASKPPGSVLYVSFGSLVQTSKHVIEEVAHGLLLSGVNFIWAIRVGIVGHPDTNGLPDGFQGEIKEKGLIVPWCDQITLLSNSAVGGFVTHCGWNSVMESLWCGVPMLCYPVDYDQPINRKLVVDDWRVGINLCDGKWVDRNEVAEKIKYLMSETSSKSLRQETNKVKEMLKNAIEIDGSSERNFDQFITDLKGKINARKV